ncbi:MAG TPA: hypothetical protein VK841_16165 [Polyangiaceae bacterium]|nr:hypothetical protein [Polyangiaceae bacterium]
MAIGVLPLAFLLATYAQPARADGAPVITNETCIDANAKAQELRREGKIAASRAQLNLCANRQCPGLVRDDCTRRLDELDRAQPTIVFSVKDASGADVSAVTVSVDGRKLADKLDGAPIAVDPGSHSFTFEPQGHAPITRQFVIHEGERGRLETSAIGTQNGGVSDGHGPAVRGAGLAGTAAFDTTPTDHGSQSGQTQRIWGWSLGGVGVAGLAVGAAMGLLANSAWNDAKNGCNPMSCLPQNRPSAESDRSNALTFSTVSDVSLAAGGALVVLGGVLIWTAPHGTHASPQTGWRIVPRIGPTGADLGFQGEF